MSYPSEQPCACTSGYTSLKNYSRGSGIAASAPISAAIPSMATQTVFVTPAYGGNAYSAMSAVGGRVANGGYFNLASAYGSNCGTYAARACAGNLKM